jgi:hypothetical protein
MAQQTINVGASPNDGTGTPLRTAFQYTNSNFTELYTAVGPSGNNIVVPGTATITGDLTVDTSTLKVDSANNRVGIGTASPSADAHIRRLLNGSTAELLRLDNGGSGVNTAVQMTFYAAGTNYGNITGGFGGATPILEYNVGSTGYQAWQIAGSEQMRLNSTGLGVGAGPANGKFIVGADATTDGNGSWNSTFRNTVGAATTAPKTGIAFSGYWNGTSNFANFSGITGGKENSTDANTAGLLTFWTSPNGGSPTTRLTIDSTGNVGVGVTPVNRLTIGSGSFNTSTASGSASLYATVSQGLVILADGLAVGTRGGVNNFIADTSGNLISRLTTTAPTLSDNGYMVFNLTSNTNLRITVRCNDGTTRTANITLA